MAPMTGTVSDAEKDGFVFASRSLKRLFSPRIPINRIVRMLKQVWTGFPREPIRLATLVVQTFLHRLHLTLHDI